MKRCSVGCSNVALDIANINNWGLHKLAKSFRLGHVDLGCLQIDCRNWGIERRKSRLEVKRLSNSKFSTFAYNLFAVFVLH